MTRVLRWMKSLLKSVLPERVPDPPSLPKSIRTIRSLGPSSSISSGGTETGLFESVIKFLRGEEEAEDESVLAGLNDIQREMCREYGAAEGISLAEARERL